MNDESSEPSASGVRRGFVGGVILCGVVLALVWWPGCRQYPPVTSRESLNLVKLLYAACNTQDRVRLAKVERGIEALSREGKLTTAEKQGFDSILTLAKANQWSQAEDAAYRFAQDQVGVGHPDPRGTEQTHKAATKSNSR